MRSPQWNGCASVLRPRPAHREPHSAIGRCLRIVGVGHHFNAGDAQIDALRRSFACRLVDVLDRSLRASARHPLRCLPRCAAGRQRVRRQRCAGAGLRLHLCAPRAQQAPQHRNRQSQRCAARETPQRNTALPPEPGRSAPSLAAAMPPASTQSQPQRAMPHGTAESPSGLQMQDVRQRAPKLSVPIALRARNERCTELSLSGIGASGPLSPDGMSAGTGRRG